MAEEAQAFASAFVTEAENDRSLDSHHRPTRIQELLNGWRTEHNGEDLPLTAAWELAALDVRLIHRRYRTNPKAPALGPGDLTALLADDQALDYYRERQKATENPIRKAKYGDLVAHALLQRGARDVYEVASSAADEYVNLLPIAVQQGHYLEASSYLDRAAEIAAQFNNKSLAERVTSALEDVLSNIPEPARYRWVLDMTGTLLALDGKWPGIVPLDLWRDVKQTVIAGSGFYEAEKPRNLSLLHALMDLAHDICAILGENDLAWSYRTQVGASWEREAVEREKEPGPIGGSLSAYKLMENALHYNTWLISQASTEEAKEQARQRVEHAKAEIRRLMRQAENEMTHIRQTADIPREALEELVEPLLKAEPSNVLALLSSAPFLLPDMEKIRQTASEFAEQFVFAGLFGQVTLRDGRKADEIPALDGEAVHLAFLMQLWYQTHCQLLHFVLHRLREEGLLSTDAFMAHMRGWDFVDEDDIPFIVVGLERYFAEDYVSALSVLTPRIEHMLRSAFEQAGVIPLVVPNQRQIREQTLGEFLVRPEVRNVLGDDLWHYFHYVLIDETGPNLRNDVAHGWIRSPECNIVSVQVILFAILVLTRFRKGPAVESEIQVDGADDSSVTLGSEG